MDIYVRVSRVGGRENLISPEEQERRARDLARNRGLRVGVVIEDKDESGGKWDRRGLQEALARVRSGESGGLIVGWLDRLSRDSEHAHRLVRELDQAGAAIYAPDAPADWKSPEGELQAGIFFAFAQYTRSRARAGFERAKERAIMAGIPVATRPAVGYRQRGDRRLEPDPKTAPVIRELFERRAAGQGPSQLADFLQGRSIKTSQGSAYWSKPSIAHVIASRVYLGELSYGRDRRYVNPHAHESIVDLATWTAAQHPNGEHLRRPRRGGYLLTGLLRCAACGYVMQGTRTSRGKRIYRCIRRHAGGTCSQPAWFFADPLEALAEQIFWSATHDMQATRRNDSDEITGLEAELMRAERRLQQAMSPDVQEAAAHEWASMIRDRRAERDAAAQALGHARAAQAASIGLPTVKTLSETWSSLTTTEKRDLLAARFDALALRRDDDGLMVAVFPNGAGPAGLSRRGFRRSPGLHPIDVPSGARMLPLQNLNERPREAAA